MSGWIVVPMVLIAIAVFVWSITASFRLLDWMNNLFAAPNSGNIVWAKLLLFVPYVALTLWCVVMQIFVVICAVFTGYQIATGVRDWMKK